MRNNKLRQIVNPSDHVCWEGKPDLKCFILESIFNPLMVFAILWGAFDFAFIFAATQSEKGPGLMFIVPFFALHLMPVWIYLFCVFGCLFRYANTAYIITDKRIYISGGTFSYSTEILPINQISQVTVHQGFFDRLIGVGDVELEKGFSSQTVQKQFMPDRNTVQSMNDLKKMYMSGEYRYQKHKRTHRTGMSIGSTSEYMKAYRLILKLQESVTAQEPTPDRYGRSDSYF